MSSGAKVVHQDYIVKQRYQNTLPPPPGAPKLLKIPFNPMDTYLSPFYLERMRRAEPINIEADAFLGMPIDLVGMPGVFEGDEKAIQAPLNPPPIHPRDKLLLRPLKALGKGGSEPSDISFLRRTQYVANDDRAGRASAAATGFNHAPVKRRRIDASKEDLNYILRATMKGFDIANPSSAPTSENGIRALPPTREELDAWNKPKHPSKPHLKLLDSYPLLPDLNSITSAPDGGFSVISFKGLPTSIKDQYDERLDAAVVRSLIDELVIQDYQTRMRAHNANPSVIPRPQAPSINFELFIPLDTDSATTLKRKRDMHDPDRDAQNIKLKHARNYESGLQTENQDKYQEVGLTLYDPADSESSRHAAAKAAYFYPITGKVYAKPRRNLRGKAGEDDEMDAHEVDLRFRDPELDERERREGIRSVWEGRAVEMEVEAEVEREQDQTMENGPGVDNDDDDAEGDDE